MQVYTADGTAIRGDVINRVVLRTDLTPIPSTVELSLTSTKETAEAIQEGKVVQVGQDRTEYLLVKVGGREAQAQQGGRDVASIKAVGILNSCAALARRLQRSIIREGSTFADIYKSIGATATVDSDFTVPRFAALVGCIPTPEIAKVLQEEAATVFLQGGRVRFRRLADLSAEKASVTFKSDRTESVASALMERHSVPFAFTTTPDNTIVSTKRESARGVVYRPRADTRILNNMGVALVQRCKLREGLSPTLNAGARVDIAGNPYIIITAAHVREMVGGESSGEEYSQLWLGQVVS